MPPKISIIIPVYNVEPYLRQCLDSVVAQTLQDIQIICVNDGSTDGSQAILREYEARDPRVEIIDQPNGGNPGKARNAGIPHIRGEYLYFLDADDWIDPTLCEKTYYRLESTGADVVFFSHHEVLEKGEKMYRSNSLAYCRYPLTSLQAWNFIDGDVVPWNRVIRSSFFQRLGVRFPEMFLPEDIYLHWAILVNDPHVELIPETLYYYRIRGGSIMGRGKMGREGEYMSRTFFVYSLIKEYLQSIGKYEQHRTLLLTRKLSSFVNHTPRTDPYSTVSQFRASLDDDEMDFLRNDQNLKASVRDPVLYLLGNQSLYWKYVWYRFHSCCLRKIVKPIETVVKFFQQKNLRCCQLRIQELSERLAERDRHIVELQNQQQLSETHCSERHVA